MFTQEQINSAIKTFMHKLGHTFSRGEGTLWTGQHASDFKRMMTFRFNVPSHLVRMPRSVDEVHPAMAEHPAWQEALEAEGEPAGGAEEGQETVAAMADASTASAPVAPAASEPAQSPAPDASAPAAVVEQAQQETTADAATTEPTSTASASSSEAAAGTDAGSAPAAAAAAVDAAAAPAGDTSSTQG